MNIIGIDQSARGTAMVALKDGEFHKMRFYADTIKNAKQFNSEGALFPFKVKAGDEKQRMLRLDDLRFQINNFIKEIKPEYIAFEDYAITRQAYNEFLGEVGGILRMVIWKKKIPYRTYDIHSVKFFATNIGNAEKSDMVLSAYKEYGLDFTKYGTANGAAGNITDAFYIAKILWTELKLRKGEIEIKDLDEGKIKVFTRTTKQKPVNILNQDFVLNE